MLRHTGITVQPGAQNIVTSRKDPFPLAVMPDLFSALTRLVRYSDSLRAGRSVDRIPVGVRFSEPVQTGPGPHPAS
jgi:hypothetical protein